MKKLLIVISSVLLLASCAADDVVDAILDDDCTQNVAGCPSSDYSCPVAGSCYSTLSGCQASGECD